jgi:hypothetical protein
MYKINSLFWANIPTNCSSIELLPFYFAGSSTFSLDEGDSAFYSTDDSACSTASLSSSPGKRNSELSSNVSETSKPMPSFLAEWTEEDEGDKIKWF